MPILLKETLGIYPEANQVVLGEFTIQDDVEMCRRLHDYYYNFQGFDLDNEIELSAISERLLWGGSSSFSGNA